ncbi:MAG TPA: hypothetical protein PLG15_02365 [Candidatus Gastranaerophilaceae bacterium]|nr:hypothetical protein [Candidatus Gastranaerophilaceae bacterium]HPT41207.1 hypothetical protein [Candidatus Gastranaerophilaceae bacterium]
MILKPVKKEVEEDATDKIQEEKVVQAPFVDRSEDLFEYMEMIAFNNRSILKIA